MVIFSGILHAPDCHAWLIFFKPEFKGRIIDAETQKPIEGVVVVAMYWKDQIIGLTPGGTISSRFAARETLTNKNGIFRIPAYITLMSPNATEGETDFIIFKPGYWSYPQNLGIKSFKYCRAEEKFSRGIGEKSEKYIHTGRVMDNTLKTEKVTIIHGIVALPRVNTWKERWKAGLISIPDFKLPIVRAMSAKEDEWLHRNKGWRR